MALDVRRILADLVAIPSVNPMGQPLTESPYLEHRVGDYLQQFFTRLGVRWFRQPVAPGRDNLLAAIDGAHSPASGGTLTLWDAHQDTVPVDGMSIPPWTPEIRAGRLYGRGACDIKGGLAAMLVAFARVSELPTNQRPNLALACTVNEEHGFSGAKALCKLFASGDNPLLPRAPDACIVAEPTNLDVVVAHRGVVRWRCHTHGRAAHSSQPQLGENAIYAMGKLLALLERYQREVAPRLPAHPLCGPPTLSVGTIRGGLSVNTVPDHCTIELDRRLPPSEDPLAAQQHVIQYLAENADSIRMTHDAPLMSSGGLTDRDNAELAQTLIAAARGITDQCRTLGVPFGTNAAAYSAANVPTVVFGPGSIEQAHTADEWISLDELEKSVEIYYRSALA